MKKLGQRALRPSAVPADDRCDADPGEFEPLTPAQLRELKRRIADLDDRARYILASVFGPRFILYYNISEDTFAMNNPRGATLFKRRATAQAVAKLMRRDIDILECRVTRSGRLVVRSVAAALRARDRLPPDQGS